MAYRPNPGQIWLRAWCAVANASNMRDKDVCDRYADHCVAEYEKRFRENGERKPESKNG